MIHTIGEVEGGFDDRTGMMSWIQPNCTCGWVGKKEYAYNNWQYTDVLKQTRDHLKQARKKNLEETHESM